MLKLRQYTVIIMVCTLAFACSNKEEAKKTPPAEELYNSGMNDIQERSYKKAVENFQKIEGEYPYSKWATKGTIMAAYASYKGGEFDDAINFLESYIKLHPGGSDVAYAYYLKALSYYDRIVDVGRDQKITEQAQSALKEVIARFPQTEYARDSQLKLDLVNDHLAGKEMEIGRFYEKNGQCVGAINRFKKVVDRFQTTSHTPEALHRLVECYTTLGVDDEAKKYAAVLGHNFPNSKWYKYSYTLFNKDDGADLPQQPPKPWYRNIFGARG